MLVTGETTVQFRLSRRPVTLTKWSFAHKRNPAVQFAGLAGF